MLPAEKTKAPPIPELPLPTTTLIEPPLPLVAVPDNTDIHPLLPDADVPVLSDIIPDTPAEPTSAVDTVTDPEPELTLDPLLIVAAPPTPVPVACPLLSAKKPPALAGDVD